ncbi:MAG: MoaD/ThiS family protein [Planctomycetes bacterium]|nr:MoaD/ThiS family protein [Planctomycetota bacterium]
MATVWIPSLLRNLADQHESVEVAGATVGELIGALEARFPALRGRLRDGDKVHRGLAVVVDGQIARGGLTECVPETAEVHFIPAIAGG